jgi:drug/metabolite transporter (DMT)-like permease
VSPWVAGLVLASAVLHASWNALLKGGGDRLRSVTVMAVAASLTSAAWAAFLPFPRAASWLYIGLSVVLHVAYNLLLVTAYRHGDLGVTYPVARGSSPLLVAAGAAVLAGERLDAFTVVGIALVCGGILGLAREGLGGKRLRAVVPALLTGVTIAAYTVVDGLGSRASGDPRAYAAWLFLTLGPAMLPAWAWRGWRRRRQGGLGGPGRADGRRARLVDAAALRSAAGGVVSLVAYAIVIWAASVSPIGPVSALRESSVVVAAVLGWLFLGERLGPWRLSACLVVAAGAACLGLRG